MSKIYIIQCNEYYKVGISKSPRSRLKQLQTSNPYELKLKRTYKLPSPKTSEALIHMMLKEYHVRGEWFNTELDVINSVIESLSDLDSEGIKYAEKQMAKKGDSIISNRRQKYLKRSIKAENERGEIELDCKMIKSFMTKGVGLPKWKANILGVKYPLKRGWFKKIIGKTISNNNYNILMGVD